MKPAMLTLLALACAAPGAADWLVLRDGTRIETDGAWKVKSRQVVFTRAGGSLSALRLADVDLEASERATAESREPAAAAEASPAPARRRSVRVFTDEDIPPAAPPDDAGTDEPEADAADTDDEAPEDAASSEPAEPVVLERWSSRESSDVDGLEIYGSVRNTGEGVAAALNVRVSVADEDGNSLIDTRAFLEHSSLAAGTSGTFRALLPGVYTLLADPTFEISSDGFTIQSPGTAEEDATEETAEAEAEVAATEG